MFNIALAIAFAISFLFSPGGLILRTIIGKPELQSLPVYQGHLLLAFANYWVPAVLIYFLLRLSRAGHFLQPRVTIHILLGLANILLILYVAARVFASTIEGGGASFVVISFSPFVIFPALALLVVGLGWLAIRSITERKELPQSSPHTFSIADGIMIVLMLGAPSFVVASTLFLAENAPFRLAREAKVLFDEHCKTAGERIIESPQDVQSIYLDRDGGQYFDNIDNGIYTAHGGGVLGYSFVNSGLILYYEKQNDRPRQHEPAVKYRKHVLRDWKGEPVEELTSDYGVFQTDLVNKDQQKRLQVRGTEVTVKNLKTGQVVATLTYFTSNRHRAICGHSDKRQFSVSDFIRRSLNLTRRFPTMYPDDAEKKRVDALRNIIGKQCNVFTDHVIVNPDKEKVLSWPDDPNIKKSLVGALHKKIDSGKIVYETVYNASPYGYWHNKKVFIAENENLYFLVPEEGIESCR